jgi:hypothetical protein
MDMPSGLSDPERRMWEAFVSGANVDFRMGSSRADDPEHGGDWGRRRQVRAEILARLLCGEVAVPPGGIGSVRLVGARIIGDILLQDVELKHSLWLEGCHVAGTIDLTEAETRSLQLDNCYLGPVRMIGVIVTGSLSLRGSHLHGDGELAFQADMATVSGAVLCDGGFQADGAVTLPGAKVEAQVSFGGARLNGANGYALMADRLVTQDLFCDAGFTAKGMVSLAYATVGVIQDAEDSWPKSLNVDGLRYDDLQPFLPAAKRLEWLARSARYHDQPYEQLAAYYRQLGSDEQARIVLLARQRQRRRQQHWWLRWWGWMEDALVGYGYAPGRALAWLTAAFAVGCFYFNGHHPAPVDPSAHPTFYAALYSFGLLIPIQGISNVSAWNPGGTELYLTVAFRALGWLLAITIGAAITRILSRR